MKPWEMFLLKFVQVAAPLGATIFIHNKQSNGAAIFNASDELYNGVVDAMTTAQAPAAAAAAADKVAK